MSLRYDPEYKAAMAPFLAAPKPPLHKTVYDLRDHTNTSVSAILKAVPFPTSVTQTKLSVPRPDGTTLHITRFTPEAAAARAGPQPAVLDIYPGGMVAGSVEMMAPAIALRAEGAGASVFAVHYRLAPEHPAPAAVEDAYAALEYMSSRAGELGIDAARIGVNGTSGGGALAAGVALMARDKGLSPPVKKLVLVYPMLDDRTGLDPESSLNDFLIWRAHDNDLAWRAVLGDEAGKKEADVSPYSAPGRATDLRGLPSTYIDCGGLDLFLRENIAFAGRLAEADVEVEFHVWPGVPHLFEAAGVSVSKKAAAARAEALRSL